MVKTWARHNATDTVLNSGWLAVVGGLRRWAVGGWRWLAAGGWWLAVGGWRLVVGGLRRLAVGGWWSLGAVLKGRPRPCASHQMWPSSRGVCWVTSPRCGPQVWHEADGWGHVIAEAGETGGGEPTRCGAQSQSSLVHNFKGHADSGASDSKDLQEEPPRLVFERGEEGGGSSFQFLDSKTRMDLTALRGGGGATGKIAGRP